MFPFGLPEFLFTLLVCFNAEAPCNDGIVVAQKPKCEKPTISHLTCLQVLHLQTLCFQIPLKNRSVIVWGSIAQQKQNVSHPCNFKHSTINIIKEKETHEINVHNVFELTQYIQHVVNVTRSQHKRINMVANINLASEIFYILLSVFKICCVLHR